MVFRPRKEMHFNRRVMGWVFLLCGLLLFTVHYLAGLPFLLFAAVFLYYAPRWDLRIDADEASLRFSQNVLDTAPVELPWGEVAEIRKVSEAVGRKSFLTGHSEYMEFVEFVTRGGKVWRMHDIFGDDLEEALQMGAAARGIEVKDFGN